MRRETRRASTGNMTSYYQLAKKSPIGRSYLHHPTLSLFQTIVCHNFEDFVRVIQFRTHLLVRERWLRALLGMLFQTLYICGMLLFLPISLIEVLFTLLSSIFNDQSASQIGLLAQFLYKNTSRSYAREYVNIFVEDEEMEAVIRSAHPVLQDSLGWKYEFPEHVRPDQITQVGRCWRMANDYRIRIMVLGNSLECVPSAGSRPLSIDNMYMTGRIEVQRTPVLKVVEPCVRLLNSSNENPRDKVPDVGLSVQGVIKGKLFRQFNLLALRDRLVRDHEARSFGADPDAPNAMTRFMKNYIRVGVQILTWAVGYLLFRDSTGLERAAFALSLGVILSEMWARTTAPAVEIPVGKSPGSPWNTDRESFLRFRERRDPWSSKMSGKNFCFLLHRPDGKEDVGPVRCDELAILHGVFVTRNGFALIRDGYELHIACVHNLNGGATLCIGEWEAMLKGNVIDKPAKLDGCSADRCVIAEGRPLYLVDSDVEIGCEVAG